MPQDTPNFKNPKKILKRLQNLSEWQKIVLAVFATLVVAIVFMFVVNFLNSLILNYN